MIAFSEIKAFLFSQWLTKRGSSKKTLGIPGDFADGLVTH